MIKIFTLGDYNHLKTIVDMRTIRFGKNKHKLDLYDWQHIERFVMEFDFKILGHEQIISLGVKNIDDLCQKLKDESEEVLKDLEKKHPGNDEYISQMAGDYGAYESMIISNYSEILWKSTIVYQVNQIESHLKELVRECAKFFRPDDQVPNPKDKILSTYHCYLIDTCGIKSAKLNKLGPKMLKYYKVRNCIVHHDSIPDTEVKEIIRLYKKVDIKLKENYNPSINELLNKEYCMVMLSDIKLYFKELYISIDNMYAAREEAHHAVESQILNIPAKVRQRS